MPQTIIVASTNPVKVAATRQGFQAMFPDIDFSVQGASVPSGVSDQPMTHAETLQGARNRAANAADAHPNAVYTVGIEGGVQLEGDALAVFAWVVVQAQNGSTGRAQTGVFYLPQEVTRLILDEGMELGHADDAVFGRSDSKRDNGSIGILTDNAMTRTSYYVNAVIMALIPFKQSSLTWKI